MSTSANPFQSPLDELFTRFNILNGLLSFLEDYLNNFRKSLMENIDKGSIDQSHLFSGTSLVIQDLSEWHEDRWARYYPTGKFVRQGEAYLQIVDVLMHRECAWTISQAYEAFQTFLKDITATYLWIHGGEDKDIEHWKESVREHCWKKVDFLALLREIAPELKEVEQQNNRTIELSEWHSVAAAVRHAATHSNMLIKSNEMHKWSQVKHDLLAHFFPGTYTDGGYRLDLCRKDADSNLNLFAEYAFTVFKSLSKLDSYRWNMLPGITNKDAA